MKRSPRDVAKVAAGMLQRQIAAGIQRGKLIGDRNVYFTDAEIEEMAAEASQLVVFFESAEIGVTGG